MKQFKSFASLKVKTIASINKAANVLRIMKFKHDSCLSKRTVNYEGTPQ